MPTRDVEQPGGGPSAGKMCQSAFSVLKELLAGIQCLRSKVFANRGRGNKESLTCVWACGKGSDFLSFI